MRASGCTTNQRVPGAVEPLPLSLSARRPTRRAVVVVEPRSDGPTPAACLSHPPAATASNQLRLRYRSAGWRSIPIPIPTPTPMKGGDARVCQSDESGMSDIPRSRLRTCSTGWRSIPVPIPTLIPMMRASGCTTNQRVPRCWNRCRCRCQRGARRAERLSWSNHGLSEGLRCVVGTWSVRRSVTARTGRLRLPLPRCRGATDNDKEQTAGQTA
jgi:hypothetical protein